MAGLAAMAIVGATGCAGEAVSGSAQPGVAPPAAAPGGTQRASVAASSEKDLQAALRANDVDDPGKWAKVVSESGPYPSGQAGEQRMRDALTRNGAEPQVVDGVLATLTP